MRYAAMKAKAHSARSIKKISQRGVICFGNNNFIRLNYTASTTTALAPPPPLQIPAPPNF